MKGKRRRMVDFQKRLFLYELHYFPSFCVSSFISLRLRISVGDEVRERKREKEIKLYIYFVTILSNNLWYKVKLQMRRSLHDNLMLKLI